MRSLEIFPFASCHAGLSPRAGNPAETTCSPSFKNSVYNSSPYLNGFLPFGKARRARSMLLERAITSRSVYKVFSFVSGFMNSIEAY